MGKILIEDTILQFGYEPINLKDTSEKLVVWQCISCNCIVNKKYRSALKTNLCLNCSNKINANTNKDKKIKKLIEWHKNNKHPLEGKKRSECVRKAISKAKTGSHISEETKKKLSLKNSGSGNPFYGKKHSQESIMKMVESSKKTVKRGKDCNFYGKCYHGKGSYYICKNDTKIWMRSSWEIKFAKYLDDNNINWLFEPIAFPIIYNNINGTYRPDFYIIEEHLYIEIKGWWRGDSESKYNAFKEQYSNLNIEVYDKEKLKKLKVL